MATTADDVVTTVTRQPVTLADDATPIVDGFAQLDLGTYLLDTVGTPFTFDADQPIWVADNDNGRVIFTHPASQGADDRVIAFLRLSELSDPTQPTAVPGDLHRAWPATDVDRWLDAASDRIVATDRQDVTLGGRDAIRFDLRLGAVDCRPGVTPCAYLGANGLAYVSDLQPDALYRIWFVDQDDEDPLVVIVAVDRESDLDWFDTADRILSSLAYGEVAPNPVLDALPGPAELPLLGGIRIEIPPETYALRDPAGFGRVPIPFWEGHTGFLANPRTLDGTTLQSVDQLVDALRSAGIEVQDDEGMTIDGLPARTFEVAADPSEPLLRFDGSSGRAWSAPPRARVWAMEHPDRGLLVITAEVFENLDIVYPAAVAQSEAIVASLEFTGTG